MDHWTTEQLRQLVCSKDLDSQLAQLEKLLRCLGFDCYAFSFTTPTFSITQSNCPNPWGERYRRHEPAVVEPLLAHSRHSSFPLLWTPEAFTSPPSCGQARRITAFASAGPNPFTMSTAGSAA